MHSSVAPASREKPHHVSAQPRRWAVVGGGILGMELARLLQGQGQHVTLIEAAPHLGGLADAWQLGDVTWDRHYHVILLSDTRLRALLETLGLAERMHWVETKTGFYTDGRLYSMSNAVEFLKFPPLRLIDKVRLASTIMYASRIKDCSGLEQVPVEDWLRKWSGQRTTEKIWLPLLRAKLGENYRYASAAFIWAIIARMYAARRTGLKKEMFGYVAGGYRTVIDQLTAHLHSLGVQTQVNTPVMAIRRDDAGLRIHYPSGETANFDEVVVTSAGPIVANLCPDLTEAERSAWAQLRYQGIVCASLVLRKPLDRFYVTNITDGWVPFTAVIEMTTLVDREQFGGHTLVYLPKYVDPQDPLFEESDEVIRTRFVDALQKMYPHFQPEDVLAFRVSRARHVLAISTLNYSQTVPGMQTSVPGLHIINSAQITHGTLNVNETLQLADRGITYLQARVQS